MNTLEIARKMAAMGERAEAVKAYKLALNECQGADEAAEMECALGILQFGKGKDYQISFSTFVDLHKRGFMPSDIKDIMTLAFYQPNTKMLKKRYDKNCRLLRKYPYIFRQDFLDFEELPLTFYPFDDNKYVPYNVREQGFEELFLPQHPVISRNFFADLDKPILAADVFSQYELEYLNDNVRKSEYIGRENHVYLHYTNWAVFCAYLQVWDLAETLKERKIVYLIEDEIAQYPIDFKERFGIDYSQYELQPLHIREINRLIWHTQLSSDNGGDYFNEIFDSHPNLLAQPSVMFDETMEVIHDVEQILDGCTNFKQVQEHVHWQNKQLLFELYNLRGRTHKDIMAALYLHNPEHTSPGLDSKARIAPVIFFQPHSYNINYDLQRNERGQLLLASEQYDKVCQAEMFRGFKYIKTFTPMRTITSANAATIKYKWYRLAEVQKEAIMDDTLLGRVQNRSFMIDWQNRLFKDCRLVRFEDGKLNRVATFRALAAFLDLPYTESMTYCSKHGKRNPLSDVGNDVGFSPATIYRKNERYSNDFERAFIEFCMRDVYKFYGYDFEYYDGQPVDDAKLQNWLDNFTTLDKFIYDIYVERVVKDEVEKRIKQKMEELNGTLSDEEFAKARENLINDTMAYHMAEIRRKRLAVGRALLDDNLQFINKNGQPLHMMPMLELDPALLEMPLYRSTTFPVVEIDVQEFSHEEMKPIEKAN